MRMIQNKWLGTCVLCSLSVLAISCSDPSASPTQTEVFTEQTGKLTEWGQGLTLVFERLSVPTGRFDKRGPVPMEIHDDYLVARGWRGNKLGPDVTHKVPSGMSWTPLCNDRWAAFVAPEAKGPNWPLTIYSGDRFETPIHKHAPPKDWAFESLATNRRGDVCVLMAKPDRRTWSGKRGTDPRRMGIVNLDSGAIRWQGVFAGHNNLMFPNMTVSEDQRYVAIGGWNNGAAIYDLHTEKVLWAKRPKGEVSTRFAYFSKDGKMIYTGGTEGAVYGIDVLTGEVKSKRWATPTGESIYGFRIMAMAVSLDGRWLAAGTGPEGTVYVWDLHKPANEKPRVFKHGQLSILVVQFSPTSDHVVALGEGMKVWKLE